MLVWGSLRPSGGRGRETIVGLKELGTLGLRRSLGRWERERGRETIVGKKDEKGESVHVTMGATEGVRKEQKAKKASPCT